MREFKCPVCGRKVGAKIGLGGDASLKHPLPMCAAKPGDLLRAYIVAFKPRHRYDTFENIAESMADKVAAMMGQK